jgi:NhaA family Na+:H+ antiporter
VGERLLVVKERAAQALVEFLKLESAGGLLLVLAAVLGLVAANSPLAGGYLWLQDLPLTVKLGSLGVDKPLLLWINDGLMAVFFLLVALELKREALQGVFTDRRLIVLPAACALGGMLVPMGIYAWLNRGPDGAMAGAAIPAATDIAFALGVLSLLGSRVPVALKVLLTAIAVLDDLGAIVIIAIYYTDGLSALSLGVAGAALTGLVIANRAGVTRWSVYILLGLVMWVAVLKSGVHATLAGVALGMTIPIGDSSTPRQGPLARMEHALHPWVAYGILPLFAFANAGVSLAGASVATLAAPVPLGIALGLFVGKPLGVFGAAAAMIGCGLARRPNGVTWPGLWGMSILCGIGFTMSLFIGSLAFADADDAIQLGKQVGIFAGSLASALAGFAVLRLALRSPRG